MITKKDFAKGNVIFMDFHSIQCFSAAAKYLNFTRAANELFISQSALSQAIKRLEKELGTALFERRNNIVVLTAAGEFFRQEANDMLARYSLVKSHIADIREKQPENLSLGISGFYSYYFLPEIVAFTRHFHPLINLSCVEENTLRLQEMTANGMLDCCICAMPIEYPELNAKYLRTEEIWLALPPKHPLLEEYGEDTPIPLARLANEPFVFQKKPHRIAVFLQSLCEEAGFSPNIVFETNSTDTVDAVIAEGIGVGFVVDILVRKNRSKKGQYRRLAIDHAKRNYMLFTRKNAMFSPTIQSFFDVLPKILEKCI